MGRDARPVTDVAAELGCDWHTANRAVLAWGEALLAANTARVGTVEALGLDGTLFGRHGRWRTRDWCTSIVDVTEGQLLDIVAGRDAADPIRWLLAQPRSWRDNIDWGVLDLSGAYRRTFEVALPQARQVADPFHVIGLANNSIDEVRRRTQNDILGHRGRTDDPLYRARRLLLAAPQRLTEGGDAKLRGLLAASDPHGEVRMAWHAKEVLRSVYAIDDPTLAAEFVGVPPKSWRHALSLDPPLGGGWLGVGVRVRGNASLTWENGREYKRLFGPVQEALPVSGVSHNIDRFGVVFDDESLVADAGLVAAGTLMGRLGVAEAVDASVRLGRRPGAASPGRKVQTLRCV